METATRRTISIGRLSERTGLAVSAIRFYEEAGLIAAVRDSAGRRQFASSDIRRVSFVIVAQKLGFKLDEIRRQLDALPQKRTPSVKDWDRISRNFRDGIDERIQTLQVLRDRLTDCIGCGCLSLKKCALSNRGDAAARHGSGPRYLLGDKPYR